MGTPVGCGCRFVLLNNSDMNSFQKGPSDACRRQIAPVMRSLLSWTHCLCESLQPEGSFDHRGINSAGSSGTEWSVTEIVRSRFLSGSRERSFISLWQQYII